MLVTKILEGTLSAGQTTITFTDSEIPNSFIRVGSTNPDLFPTEQTISGNTLTIKYEAQSSSLGVVVELVKAGMTINDTLTSTATDEALSANQGKALKDLIDSTAATPEEKASWNGAVSKIAENEQSGYLKNKNLLSGIENGTINSSGADIANIQYARNVGFIPVISGKTYTMSLTPTGGKTIRISTNLFASLTSGVTQELALQNDVITFTVPDGINYVRFVYFTTGTKADNPEQYISDAQLEKGSTATAYTPYAPSNTELKNKINSLTVDDLQDVVITSPTDDDVLTYDNGEWVNKPAQGGSALNVYDFEWTATTSTATKTALTETKNLPAGKYIAIVHTPYGTNVTGFQFMILDDNEYIYQTSVLANSSYNSITMFFNLDSASDIKLASATSASVTWNSQSISEGCMRIIKVGDI